MVNSLPLPVEVPGEIAGRLRAATVAHRDAQEIAHRTSKEWRALVAEAIDAGLPQHQVAQLAGVSRSRVHAIVVGEYSRP